MVSIHDGACTSVVICIYGLPNDDCETGSQGILELKHLRGIEPIHRWDGAFAACTRLCQQCNRCRYVSVSLPEEPGDAGDCWWYNKCTLDSLVDRSTLQRYRLVLVRRSQHHAI
jgi:hypothetical protein